MVFRIVGMIDILPQGSTSVLYWFFCDLRATYYIGFAKQEHRIATRDSIPLTTIDGPVWLSAY